MKHSMCPVVFEVAAISTAGDETSLMCQFDYSSARLRQQ
jgi:hypothetical protein